VEEDGEDVEVDLDGAGDDEDKEADPEEGDGYGAQHPFASPPMTHHVILMARGFKSGQWDSFSPWISMLSMRYSPCKCNEKCFINNTSFIIDTLPSP
jgi:hypothetical protein